MPKQPELSPSPQWPWTSASRRRRRYLDRNKTASLQVEATSNSYRTFVLLWLPQRERFTRRRVLAPCSVGTPQ